MQCSKGEILFSLQSGTLFWGNKNKERLVASPIQNLYLTIAGPPTKTHIMSSFTGTREQHANTVNSWGDRFSTSIKERLRKTFINSDDIEPCFILIQLEIYLVISNLFNIIFFIKFLYNYKYWLISHTSRSYMS